MKINGYSQNAFRGRLILQGELCPHTLAKVINNNPVISKLLKNTDKDLCVILKHRTATPNEIYYMGRDENLYKITFKLQQQAKGFFEKVLAILNNKQVNLSNNYHSEYTIKRKLSSEKYLSSIFDKIK